MWLITHSRTSSCMFKCIFTNKPTPSCLCPIAHAKCPTVESHLHLHLNSVQIGPIHIKKAPGYERRILQFRWTWRSDQMTIDGSNLGSLSSYGEGLDLHMTAMDPILDPYRHMEKAWISIWRLDSYCILGKFR